jgi:type I restriction enzyme S subunit
VSERVPIGELGQVVTGRTPPTTDPLSVGVDIPFVTPGDVGYGVEVRRVGRRISHHGATASRVIPGGSVLAVCIGATLGKVGFSGVPVAFNQQINGVVLPQIEDAELLASLLAAPSFQSAMWQASSATTMPLLNKSTFSQLEVPLVPSGRRAEFLAKTRSAGEAVDRVGTDVDRAFTRSAALRRSLLAAAFSGRLTTELPQTAESTLAV